MDDVQYIRTSERKSFKTCRQQWWWTYIDRIRPVSTRPALRFGSLIHGALAEWYIPGRKRGHKPWLTFERLYNAELESGLDEFSVRLEDDEEWANALELGIEMLTHYVNYWGDDDHMEIISPEFPFHVPMTDKRGRPMSVLGTDDQRHPLVYAGRFDALYRDHSKAPIQIGLLETKTAAAISNAILSALSLDEQAGSYWAMAPLVLPTVRFGNRPILRRGQDIDFVMYNFLRKAKPDTRPKDSKGNYLNQPTKEALKVACAQRGLFLRGAPTREAYASALEGAGVNPLLFGEVSKVQPVPYFVRQPVYRDEADRRNLLTRVRMEAYEMGLVRSGKLPVYKNPSLSWPDQHCLGCGFREMCELHETDSDWEEYRSLTMEEHDPYEDHNFDDWEYE